MLLKLTPVEVLNHKAACMKAEAAEHDKRSTPEPLWDCVSSLTDWLWLPQLHHECFFSHYRHKAVKPTGMLSRSSAVCHAVA